MYWACFQTKPATLLVNFMELTTSFDDFMELTASFDDFTTGVAHQRS
jgi:hypothetical protein